MIPLSSLMLDDSVTFVVKPKESSLPCGCPCRRHCQCPQWFLVANTQFCLSISPSVRRSITQCKSIPKGNLTCVSATAHPYATDAVVFTALFPSRVRETVICCDRLNFELSDCWESVRDSMIWASSTSRSQRSPSSTHSLFLIPSFTFSLFSCRLTALGSNNHWLVCMLRSKLVRRRDELT